MEVYKVFPNESIKCVFGKMETDNTSWEVVFNSNPAVQDLFFEKYEVTNFLYTEA